MSASHISVYIPKQKCQIIILFHDCSMIYHERDKKSDVCHFWENIGFLVKGELASTYSIKSVL
jgi:hypothetical protein